MKGEPNNVTATLKVVVTGEFYDDYVTEETLRYIIEQDLEDAGFEVDTSLLKEQEPVKPDSFMDGHVQRFACKKCGKHLLYAEWGRDNYCSRCGQAVKWE